MLQRYLTDSTVLRNLGVPLGHTLIALKSTAKGLSKLVLNKEAIDHDLDNNWSVIAEAIQTVLRREGYPKPYDALKDLPRKNGAEGQAEINPVLDDLQIKNNDKAEKKNTKKKRREGKK